MNETEVGPQNRPTYGYLNLLSLHFRRDLVWMWPPGVEGLKMPEGRTKMLEISRILAAKLVPALYRYWAWAHYMHYLEVEDREMMKEVPQRNICQQAWTQMEMEQGQCPGLSPSPDMPCRMRKGETTTQVLCVAQLSTHLQTGHLASSFFSLLDLWVSLREKVLRGVWYLLKK